jgi:hypothetical protein
MNQVTENDRLIFPGAMADEWYVAMCIRPTFTSTADSLGAFFKSFLPADPRILGVYWLFEGETVRIWTAIEDADFNLERPIYDAQIRFIEKMSDLECDFSVIYRQGRDLAQLLPTDARPVA